MERRPRVAVIGGGISGLATANFLRRGSDGPPPDVIVIEAANRLGGKVFTLPIDGLPVDTGPDAFLARVPAMSALVKDLGLSDAIVPAAPLGAYLWSRGRLRRLPAGTIFGVPDRLLPLLRSRLLSPSGILRAGLDVVLPRQDLPEDATIAELLRPRLGGQLVDRLVEPLIGGVHAGSTAQLSARSTVPDIDSLVRANRSLYLALRRRRRKAGPGGGAALVTLDGGLSQLIEALSRTLDGSEISTDSTVTALDHGADGFRLTVNKQGVSRTVEADAVVLATPAFVTAELLDPLVPTAAAALRAVPYVDVATITLVYPRHAVGSRLDATGFLVPPAEGRLLVGCSWLTAKWSHLAGGPSVVFRALVGRTGDDRWTTLDDDALVARVHEELAEAISLSGPPERAHVQRWPRALPQYTVGHRARVTRVTDALAELPGLHVTGAAYSGVGLAGCVAQAEQTAAKVLAQLAAPSPAQGALT